MDLANSTPPSAATRSARFDLSTHALFRFSRYGLDDILPGGRENLEALALQLVKSHPKHVKIIGHTDLIGKAEDNQLLSERRAETIREYLVMRGVDAEIVVEGRGEREPVKKCNASSRESLVACLTPNRRVELIVEGEK